MRAIHSWVGSVVVAVVAGLSLATAAQDILVDEGEPGVTIWNAPAGAEIELTLRRDGEVYCERAGIVSGEPNAAGAQVFTLCRIDDADFGGTHMWVVEVEMRGEGGSISSGRIGMEVEEVLGGCFPSVTLGTPATIIVQQVCG